MKCIQKIMEGSGGIFVMAVDAAMDRVVPLEEIEKYRILLKAGDILEEEAFSKNWSPWDMKRPDLWKQPESLLSAGILDVYPYTADCPYRIELWGDEIDSIRSFDAESQRSIEEIETLVIDPATEIILEEERIAFGLSQMEKDYKKLAEEFHKKWKQKKRFVSKKEIKRIREELSELHMLIGAEGYLPYFYDKLTSVLTYFPEDTLVYLDEPKHIKERAEAFFLNLPRA